MAAGKAQIRWAAAVLAISVAALLLPATASASLLTGHPLTVSAASWSGAGNSYAYQWQRSTGGSWSAISGATSTVYTPSSADLGAALRVVVSASNPDGRASAATAATARLLH